MMSITVYGFRNLLNFIACSDAPHKRSFHRDEVQGVGHRGSISSDRRIGGPIGWDNVRGGRDESNQGGIFHA